MPTCMTNHPRWPDAGGLYDVIDSSCRHVLSRRRVLRPSAALHHESAAAAPFLNFGATPGVAPGPGVYNRRSMQPVTIQEQVEYASLGWRFTAVLIDTVVLLGLWIIVLMVYIFVLAGQGRIDPNDPAAAQQLSQQLGGSGVLNVVLLGSLFIYYVVLESIFAASVGKLVCRMRVVMADGSNATGLAVVVRNVIRVPEAIFFYIPSGISCAVSPRRQRLGDHAARTVVVRRRMTVTAPGVPGPAPGAPPYGAPQSGPPAFGAPVPPAPVSPPQPQQAQPAAWPVAEPAVPAGPPPLADALRAPQDGGSRLPRRTPQLPALLRARARGRRRRPREVLFGGVRERLVHAHGRGHGAPHGARRGLCFRRAPPDRRWRKSAPRRPTSRTCCASSRPTSRRPATRASTRRSWPSPARRLLPPDAAMGGAPEDAAHAPGGTFRGPPQRGACAKASCQFT